MDNLQMLENESVESSYRAEQDQKVAELINEVRLVIGQIRADSEIASILAGAGYGEDKLEEGLAMCDIAQLHFTNRQETLNERNRLSDLLDDAEDNLNKNFSDYRVTARALFENSADRSRLGVQGHRPRDRQSLLTTAQSAFDAARKEPFFEAFSRHGFDAARFDGLDQQIVDLRQLDVTQNTAIRTAVEATRIRDESASELRTWEARLKAIGSRRLRDLPGAVNVFNV